MKGKKKLLLAVALLSLGLCGCDAEPIEPIETPDWSSLFGGEKESTTKDMGQDVPVISTEEIQEKTKEETEPETTKKTTEPEETVASHIMEAQLSDNPDFVDPTFAAPENCPYDKENDTWTDYTDAGYFPYELDWKIPEEKINELVKIKVPRIAVADPDIQDKLNTIMTYFAVNDFTTRYLPYDIELEFECEKTNDSLVLSYRFDGEIRHIKPGDIQYFDSAPNKYCFNINRLTGKVYTVDELMGEDEVRRAIISGQYSVVEGSMSVFERFTNAQLADIYLKNYAVQNDDTHQRDFYVDNGAICILIYVGAENGDYLILKLETEPKYDLTVKTYPEKETDPCEIGLPEETAEGETEGGEAENAEAENAEEESTAEDTEGENKETVG